MTGSRQDPAMRRNHMERTLRSLEAANRDLGDARDWCFDLDHFPERLDVAKAKDGVMRAISQVTRAYRKEFPDE